jgi:hypothetical protein
MASATKGQAQVPVLKIVLVQVPSYETNFVRIKFADRPDLKSQFERLRTLAMQASTSDIMTPNLSEQDTNEVLDLLKQIPGSALDRYAARLALTPEYRLLDIPITIDDAGVRRHWLSCLLSPSPSGHWMVLDVSEVSY